MRYIFGVPLDKINPEEIRKALLRSNAERPNETTYLNSLAKNQSLQLRTVTLRAKKEGEPAEVKKEEETRPESQEKPKEEAPPREIESGKKGKK